MSKSAVKAGSAYIELGIRNRIAQGAKKAERDLRRIGQSALQMGGMIGGLGLAISAPITHATLKFAEFDDAMRAVRGVTGASEGDFQQLTDTARELGRTTSFTATEVAGLMVELGRAGFKPDQINSMTDAVLNLSRATGTDAAMSAGIMSATIRQFGLGAQDAARVADVLTAAANGSFNSVESLGEAMKYAAPVAADLGMSVEETAAVLGTLGNMGIQGSEAGTALRRLAVLGAAEVTKLEKIFGISLRNAAGHALPLVDTLDRVAKATKGLDTGDRAAKFSDAFGLLGITAASAIGKTATETKELLNQLENAQGAAAATAKEMDSGVGGSLRRTTSAIEGMMLSIGDAVDEPLANMVDRFTASVGVVTEFINENQQLIVIAATVAGGLVGLGAAAAALGVSAIAAAGAIGVATTAASLLLNPITLGIGVVSGLGAVFVTQTQLGADSLDWLASRFGPLVDTAQESISGIVAAIKAGDMEKAWEMTTDLMEMVWLDLGGTIKDTWTDVMNFLLDGVTATVVGIGAAFKALSSMLNGILDAYKSAYDGIYNLTSDGLNAAGSMVTGVETIGAPAPKQSAFEKNFGGIEDTLRSKLDGVRNFGQGLQDEAYGSQEDRYKATDTERAERDERIEQLRGKISQDAAEATTPAGMLGFAPMLQAGITAAIGGAGQLGITTDDMTDMSKLTEKLTGIGEKAKSLFGMEEDTKQDVQQRFDTVAQQSPATMPTSVSSGFAAALLGGFARKTNDERILQANQTVAKNTADMNRKLDLVGKWA